MMYVLSTPPELPFYKQLFNTFEHNMYCNKRHFATFLALQSATHPSSISRPSWRARSSRKKECGRWKCIEAAGEEGFSQPRCVEVINRPSIPASCSVAFSQKKTPDGAQSGAQVSARLRKRSEVFSVKLKAWT